jgi:hypothetical protein
LASAEYRVVIGVGVRIVRNSKLSLNAIDGIA